MLVANRFGGELRADGRRWARRAACVLVGAGWAALVGQAAAQNITQNITVRSTVAEKLQYDDNIRLEPNPSGGVFGSTTSLDVAAERRTPRATLGLDFGADYNHFWGPGASSELNSLDWSTGLGGETRTARATLGGRLGYARAAVRESELLDTGATRGDTDRVIKSAAANISYAQTSRDTLGADLLLEDITFEGDDSELRNPFREAELNLRWVRALTARASGGVVVGAAASDSDDKVDTFGRKFNAGVVYEERRSPRLTFRFDARLGVAIQDRNNTERGVTTRESEASPTFEFDTGLTYALARSSVSVGVAQQVQTTAAGGQQQVRSASVGYNYELTPQATWKVTGDLVSQRSSISVVPFVGDSDRTFAALGTQVSWRFVPDWTIAAGYRFRYDDDFDGEATSNAVFTTLSYSFTPVP